MTNGQRVVIVLDVGGGDGVRDSVRSTKGNGPVAVPGFLQGQSTTLDLMDVS